jgi:hypothetical protein
LASVQGHFALWLQACVEAEYHDRERMVEQSWSLLDSQEAEGVKGSDDKMYTSKVHPSDQLLPTRPYLLPAVGY